MEDYFGWFFFKARYHSVNGCPITQNVQISSAILLKAVNPLSTQLRDQAEELKQLNQTFSYGLLNFPKAKCQKK